MIYSAMWSLLCEEGSMAKVKANSESTEWFLLTRLCCPLAVLCLEPCFTMNWGRLQSLLNCLTVWVRKSVGAVLLHVLNGSNVMRVLVLYLLREKNLVDRCCKVIDKQTKAAAGEIWRTCEYWGILTWSSSCKHVNLFKAVNLWATNECVRRCETVKTKEEFLENRS